MVFSSSRELIASLQLHIWLILLRNGEHGAKIEAQAPIFHSATLYFRDFYIKNHEI